METRKAYLHKNYKSGNLVFFYFYTIIQLFITRVNSKKVIIEEVE